MVYRADINTWKDFTSVLVILVYLNNINFQAFLERRTRATRQNQSYVGLSLGEDNSLYYRAKCIVPIFR